MSRISALWNYDSPPKRIGDSGELVSSGKSYHIDFDGNLYNHRVLIDSIDDGQIEKNSSDTEILLACYKKWGNDFFTKLRGDFAITIWDREKQQIICARDIFGYRPLYYHVDTSRAAISQDIKLLVSHCGISSKPNLGYLAESLMGCLTRSDETIIEGIMEIPPAHFMVFKKDQIERGCYWDINPHPNIEYKDDREYAEHFGELFQKAIACRVPEKGAYGIYLSGGLDSSSIAAMSQKILRQSRENNSQVHTFSIAFPNQSCDESELIKQFTTHCGISSCILDPIFEDYAWIENQVDDFYDFPDFPSDAVAQVLRKNALVAGVDILLTGIGADELLSGGLHPYRNLIDARNYKKLLQQIVSDPRSSRRISQKIPKRIKSGLQLLLPKLRWVPHWMRTEFIEASMLHDRLRDVRPAPSAFSIQKQRMYTAIRSANALNLNRMNSRSARSNSVEDRHPFRDQELVEFCFRLPESQLESQGVSKYILRNSMKDLLPDPVRNRTEKADFSYIYTRLFDALGGREYFADLQLYREAFLKKSSVLALYDDMEYRKERADARYRRRQQELWSIARVNAAWHVLFN